MMRKLICALVFLKLFWVSHASDEFGTSDDAVAMVDHAIELHSQVGMEGLLSAVADTLSDLANRFSVERASNRQLFQAA